MNEIAILTKDRISGVRLQQSLARYGSRFMNLQCLTKKDIINNPQNTKNVTAIFSTWYMPDFEEKEIDRFFPSLKTIFYAAGTVKYFAEPFLQKGIRIFSAAEANGIPVAEYVAAQIILANKGYFQVQKAYRWSIWKRGFYESRHFAEHKYGNYGAKVGIIGCGAIGSKVAELLRPYELDIIVYDPYISNDKIEDLCVRRADNLTELFAACDVITNHLPDIPETFKLIDYSLLSLMKPTATFINTGRGRQVDETALAKVLKRNPEMCALLDVTTHEPLWFWSPLYRRKNVFLTPHIAGSLSNEFERMVEYMVRAYDDNQTGSSNVCEIFDYQLTKTSIR